MKKSALLLLVFALCAAPLAAQTAADPVVISAGTVTIRQSELEHVLSTLPAEYQTYARAEGKRQFAEDYLRMRLLAAEGAKAGLSTDPAVLKQLEVIKNNLIANEQMKKLESRIKVSDAELRAMYNATMADYAQVSAKHILIAFKDSPAAQEGKPQLSEEQAKAKAEALRAQIVAGASFEELAKKESDDVASGTKGGALGEFARGQMVPEFEKAAFETPAGQISPVTRTQFGYHIVRVDSHIVTPFETVKANLEQSARKQQLQTLLSKMLTDAKPTYDETFFAAPKD